VQPRTPEESQYAGCVVWTGKALKRMKQCSEIALLEVGQKTSTLCMTRMESSQLPLRALPVSAERRSLSKVVLAMYPCLQYRVI
jgi:hypothetical protein